MPLGVGDINLTQVSVGNLVIGADLTGVVNAFMPFGCLRHAAWHPAGVAVVWFEDKRDAKEAIRCLDKTLVVDLVD